MISAKTTCLILYFIIPLFLIVSIILAIRALKTNIQFWQKVVVALSIGVNGLIGAICVLNIYQFLTNNNYKGIPYWGATISAILMALSMIVLYYLAIIKISPIKSSEMWVSILSLIGYIMFFVASGFAIKA